MDLINNEDINILIEKPFIEVYFNILMNELNLVNNKIENILCSPEKKRMFEIFFNILIKYQIVNRNIFPSLKKEMYNYLIKSFGSS